MIALQVIQNKEIYEITIICMRGLSGFLYRLGDRNLILVR
jgi:hypothetical protein